MTNEGFVFREGSTEREAQDVVFSRLEIVLKQYGYKEYDLYRARAATVEALQNAYKHGKLPATVAYYCTRTRFWVSVVDSGDGFDPLSAPDACAEENPEKSSGRGILLMQGYMDAVEFLDGGREVKMTMLPGAQLRFS